MRSRDHSTGVDWLRNSSYCVCALFGALTLPTGVLADQIDLTPRPIYNLYGEVGLLDMPTARLGADGEFAVTVSATPSEERYSLGFQALPWLETVFRYARLDRYGGDLPHSDLYDRSLSFRIRLSQEGDFLPAIAVGAQDIFGTGAFGAEYLVASKKIGDFDFTGGIGWRRFGEVATFPNPLAQIFPSFKPVNPVTAGEPTGLTLGQLFHGPDVGLFGGIEWHTPINRLSLIAELSGDRYEKQQIGKGINVKSQLNFGFSYEPWDNFQIGGGYLYGTQWGLRFTILLNPFDSPFPERLGTQPTEVQTRTPEARNQAELSLLQDATHYYDKWPAKTSETIETAGFPDQAVKGLGNPSLADVAFEGQQIGDIKISTVETYGDSLIVYSANSHAPGSCARFEVLVRAAQNAGLQQIVFAPSKLSQNVKICSVNATVAPAHDTVVQSAQLGDEVLPENQAPKAPLDMPDVTEAASSADANPLRAKVTKDAEAQFIIVQGFGIEGQQADVAFVNGTYRTDAEAVGRLLRILMADLPDDIEQFRLVILSGNTPTRQILFHRSDIERVHNLSGSASELLPTTDLLAVADDDVAITKDSHLKFPTFGASARPGYRQSLFDPQEPFRYQIYGAADGYAALSRHFSLTGTFEFNIYSTLSNIPRKSNSILPHVRSDIALYFKKGSNGIGQLSANYLTKLTDDTYFYAHAGYLESMYAGFGGEIYWQPPHQRLSFGASLYAVEQRNFDRLFGFRNYKIITGHVSAYYESPFYNLDFEVNVGRYLAGDYGATFQVTRRFDSGVEIGAFATLTNVPFSVYGEGSFDKGFIIRIPFDFVAPINTKEQINLDFTPLTRDGGQQLSGEHQLFEMTRDSSEQDLLANWDQVLNP